MRVKRLNGGAERDRTVGLLNAIQALSQLSYSPICHKLVQKINMAQERLSNSRASRLDALPSCL